MKKSSFQLVGQRLIKVDFLINKDFSNNENKIELKIIPTTNIVKDENERKASVTLNLKIYEKEKINEIPFYFDLEIEGYFIWDDSIKNEDNFLIVNAPAILISYLRSVISQLTSFAGYPPLILPLLDFTNS